MENNHRVFVTGCTGYIGTRLIPELLARSHDVIALAREQSRHKLPAGCRPAIGDALNGNSYRHLAKGADTVIHLVGVSHPSPAKAAQFRKIDLKAGLESICMARETGTTHFIYVSVAQPAPVMKAYQAARAECVGLITLRQIVQALVHAVDEPAEGVRIWDVPHIRLITASRNDAKNLYTR